MEKSQNVGIKSVFMPKNNKTRIDDVATLYNHWIKSMVDIRTIAPHAIP